jgi:LuxR family maltose regulon positive regulatory protein
MAQDWTAARTHWRTALATPNALEWYGLLSEARLRLAAVHLRLGEPGQAVPLVQAVFERCATDGWTGSALLAGPQTLALLLDGIRTKLPAATAEALASSLRVARELRYGAAPVASPAATAKLAPARPVAPVAPAKPVSAGVDAGTAQGLTAREREVLGRIAAGDSNKLIARAFDLSPHTVKRHVANILDKIGVASRGQAAAWWRDHAGA